MTRLETKNARWYYMFKQALKNVKSSLAKQENYCYKISRKVPSFPHSVKTGVCLMAASLSVLFIRLNWYYLSACLTLLQSSPTCESDYFQRVTHFLSIELDTYLWL